MRNADISNKCISQNNYMGKLHYMYYKKKIVLQVKNFPTK